MANNRVVHQLLSLWEAGRDEGRDLSAEDLCQDHPELVEEVRRQIAALRAFDSLAATRAPSATAEQGGPGPAGLPGLQHYEILEELGRGGMGVVYKAVDRRLKRTVALKMILAGAHAAAAQKGRFLREAEAVARLRHPGIVQVYELGEQDGFPFIALEYVEGGALDRVLDGTPHPARAAARLVRCLAEAVQAAHEAGIIHRDLKPGNVLLARGAGSDPASSLAGGSPAPREEMTPKIADFGLARQTLLEPEADRQPTAEGAVLGTPCYMAPEQALGQTHRLGPPADIYALGVILYEMLTGRVPFKGSTMLDTLEQVVSQEPVPPSRLQARVPRDLETICLKCLRKEPSQRYASASDLAEDLGRFLDGLPIQARPVGPAELAWRWCRRRPLVASLTAALVLALACGVGGVLWQWRLAEANAESARQHARRAGEKERLALEQKARAEASEKEEAQQRHRAEQREADARAALQLTLQGLTLGRKVVDTYLTQVSESPELKTRGLERLRRDLLLRAALYYETFAGLVRSDDPTLRTEQGLAYLRLADALQEIDAVPKAIARAEQGVATFRRLARDYPGEREHQLHLLDAHRRLGLLYLRAGRHPEAQRSLGYALEMAHEQKADYDLARCWNALGKGAWAAGQKETAGRAWEHACDILESLTRKDPKGAYHEELAWAWANRGVLAWSSGKTDEAVKVLQRVRQAREADLKARPESASARSALGSACQNLGAAYRSAKRPAEAEELWLRCRDLNQELVRTHPLVHDYRADLGSAENNLAILYAETRRPAEAEKSAARALDVYRNLARAQPEVASYWYRLGRSALGLGQTRARANQVTEALALCTEAVEALEKARGREPDNRQARQKLLEALTERAEVLEGLERHREAAHDWEKAVALGVGKEEALMRLRQATSLALAGDHAGGARLARQAAGTLDEKAPGALFYQAALACSCAARAATKDEALPPARRKKLGEEYAAEGVRLLGRPAALAWLRAGGWVSALEKHADWEPVRAHPDFPDLRARLAGPAKP